MVNSENIDGQKKEILYRTFKVLNVRNSTDYSKTQSLCTIDLFTSSSNLVSGVYYISFLFDLMSNYFFFLVN